VESTRIDELGASFNARIDELATTVNRRIDGVDARIGNVETELRELRTHVTDATEVDEPAEG